MSAEDRPPIDPRSIRIPPIQKPPVPDAGPPATVTAADTNSSSEPPSGPKSAPPPGPPSDNPVSDPGIYADLLEHELPTDCRRAANFWFEFGFLPIPIAPFEKKSVVQWQPWLDALSHNSIEAHWAAHPDHEVGLIIDERWFILDADSPEAVQKLYEIEKAFGVTPNLIVKTRKGEHHYFKREPGTYAKADSHSTDQYPDRIDVRTGRGNGEGRSFIVAPPSTNKAIVVFEATNADALTEVGQAFIDAVFRHNGRDAPRPAPDREPTSIDSRDLVCQQRDLALLLEQLDSLPGYDDWRTVGMAIHHTFSGDQEGLDLFDRWSAKGTKYPGYAEIAAKWKSFAGFSGTPVTIGSVCKIARDQGVKLEAIVGSSWEDFTATATMTIAEPAEDIQPGVARPPTPAPIFSRYTLTGYSEELAKEVQEETFVLTPLALRGQATVWYAAPNAGKTLITLNRLVCAIKDRLVDPQQVFYLNADDTSQGLLLKVKVAEQYGFNMLAPGHRDFDLKQLLVMLRQVCLDGTARQVFLIVDTLKKTTDLMDKQKSSGFTRIVREFVSHGGTFLGLAHVNKKLSSAGKSVYAGTTDIKDDFDCAYVIDVMDNGRESGTRIVEFNNEKRRGAVADTVRFRYRAGKGVSYLEMLDSVEITEATEADQGVPSTAEELDAEAISVVEHSIRAGDCKKTELLTALRKHAGLSKRNAEALLVRYTGNVPTLAKWNYEVRDRGAHYYYLLNEPADVTTDEAIVF